MKGGAEAARAHCPVCCGDLDAQLVYCARCATPHHGECWQFTGRCAIYACTSEQFTESPGGDAEDVLHVGDDAPDAPARAPLPAARAPVPRPASVPAVRPADDPAVAHLAQSKRAAFRHWLRELLDEGLAVPRLWTGAPVVQRRMRLPDQEFETESQNETRGLVLVLLAMLPFIFLLILRAELTWWVAFELMGYLGLTYALHRLASPFHRELIVDSAQNVAVERVGPGVGPRRREIGNLRQAAAVALLVEGDTSSGFDAGVVLLDFERRPIAIPGMLLPPARNGAPNDGDVRRARATARFLGLTFAGAVDARGRRRRLPAPDGTAPGSE